MFKEVSGQLSSEGKEKVLLVDLGLESSTVNLFGDWTSSLGDPLDNGVSGSASSVVRSLSTYKPVKSWEALDTESLSELFVLSSIDFGKCLWGFLLSQDLSCGRVLWFQFLTVTAPGSVEFNKQVIVFGNLFIEVRVGKDKHAVLPLGSADVIEEGEAPNCKCL